MRRIIPLMTSSW